MNIDINNIDPKLLEEDDRIVAYLKGQMSEEEELSFLKELDNNTELKEKAITIARLVKGLKDVGPEQDKVIQNAFLASTQQDVEAAIKYATQKNASAANVISLSKVAKWLSIAACFIGIVWLGFTYNTYRNTVALGNQYEYEKIFGSETIASEAYQRGDESDIETTKKLSKLFLDVKNNNNLDATIHELTLCWEVSTMDSYNDYTDFSAEIGWNLAIAYLKNNDKKEAKAVLVKLITSLEEGSVVSEKAKELLEKL